MCRYRGHTRCTWLHVMSPGEGPWIPGRECHTIMVVAVGMSDVGEGSIMGTPSDARGAHLSTGMRQL